MRVLHDLHLSKVGFSNVCSLLSVLILTVGCGSGVTIPPLGQVSGVVTVDGKPVSGATVVFEPKDKAHAASGGTDGEGKYTLNYNADTAGAAIGSYTVRIFHYGDDAEVPQEGLIPDAYGSKSELTAEVKEGENKIDFKLDSKKKKKK